MPTPTPPKPGEEPHDESALYRYHLRRLITWYLEALDPLPEDAFAWRPPASDTNSLAVICSHAISSAEWWVLSCVGDGPIERDRDAEFASASRWAEMRPRFEGFLARAEDLLARMTSEQLAAISRHPAGDRMNRRCLLHCNVSQLSDASWVTSRLSPAITSNCCRITPEQLIASSPISRQLNTMFICCFISSSQIKRDNASPRLWSVPQRVG